MDAVFFLQSHLKRLNKLLQEAKVKVAIKKISLNKKTI